MGPSDKADAGVPRSTSGSAPGIPPEAGPACTPVRAPTCTPGLHPRGCMPAGAPESEKKVYAAIADALPAGWYAWHSVKIRSEDGQNTEADFIIASPGLVPSNRPDFPAQLASSGPSGSPGASSSPSPPAAPGLAPSPQAPSASPSDPFLSPGILILEVKGGAIRKQNGQWYQGGRSTPMPKAPLDQAHGCCRALLSKFASHRLPPPAIGQAVIFPDQEFDTPPTQGDLEGVVIGARQLPYLNELVHDLMRKAIPLQYSRRPAPGWIALIHDLWCEAWPLKPNLAFQARARLEERVKLDAAQFGVLSAALENDLVLVRGGAGTGKTLLAAELARREAAAGRTALVLTYTEALAFELAKSLTPTPPAPSPDPSAASSAPSPITVSSVGRYALTHLRARGFDKPEEYAPAFWNAVTRLAASSKSLWKSCRFDTVIIDEAQDFGADEWSIAMRCAGSKKRVWAFMDESQAFWEKRTPPRPFLKRCTHLNLGKPYRCPPAIQALADAYVGKLPERGEAGTAPEAPPGPESPDAVRLPLDDGTIGIISCDRDKVHEAVGQEINRLLAEGFKPTDIAVISLRGRMFDGNIMHRTELGGRPIVEATDDRAREHIVCDTFLRYKGLERLAVIVTDLRIDSSRYAVRMNIAISRAVGILRIVAARDEIVRDQILSRY